MVSSKKRSLKPLIESRDGIHLTAYVPEPHNGVQLKKQIREVLALAREYLSPVLAKDQLVAFLSPLERLIDDPSYLKGLKGNLGIFRTKDSMRIIPVPVPVELTCVVATSFHIKPLLRWMQQDQDFILLGLEETSASLYQGSQTSFQYIDSAIYPESLQRPNAYEGGYEALKASRKRREDLGLTMKWLANWIEDMTQTAKPLLFLAGQNEGVKLLVKQLKYPNLYPESIFPSFDQKKSLDACRRIRSILRLESRLKLEEALQEFRFAQDLNLTKNNIFQIAKAAVAGRVSKLIISDEINIFGKLDRKTGSLLVHAIDLDHEDDDVLDDIAQTVLSFGGEVVVARQSEIPKGRPILAILDRPDSQVSLRTTLNERRAGA